MPSDNSEVVYNATMEDKNSTRNILKPSKIGTEPNACTSRLPQLLVISEDTLYTRCTLQES